MHADFEKQSIDTVAYTVHIWIKCTNFTIHIIRHEMKRLRPNVPSWCAIVVCGMTIDLGTMSFRVDYHRLQVM